MITIEDPGFYKIISKYIFIHPDSDIDEKTKLPIDENMYYVVDIDEIATTGPPIDPEDGVEYVLWAILTPGEKINGN